MFLLDILRNPTPFLASESVLWLVSKSNRMSDPEEWETKPLQSFIPVHPWLTGPIPCLRLTYPGCGPRLTRPHWTLGVSVWRGCAAGWSPRPRCPLWSGNRWGCYRKTGPAVCHWWSVWACWCLAEWFSECPWKRGRRPDRVWQLSATVRGHRMYCTTEKSYFVLSFPTRTRLRQWHPHAERCASWQEETPLFQPCLPAELACNERQVGTGKHSWSHWLEGDKSRRSHTLT